MKKIISIVLCIMLLLTAISGCSSSKEAVKSELDNKKIVNIVMYSAPDTFNPYFSKGNYGKYAGGELVLSTLLKYTDEWELIPSLAKEYNISDDGKEYTFILNENAKWHDGEPFTAKDVAFTIQSVMHPDWSGTGYVNVESVVGAKDYKAGKATSVPGIEIVNDYTIKIKLEKAYAPFLEAVGKGFWILPAHVFEGIAIADFEKAPFSSAPIGTGPVKFVKYVQDQYVEYDTNKDYYLGTPKFDKLILKIMTADLALAAFEKGEIDATTRPGLGTINVSDYQKVKEMPNLDVTIFKTHSQQQITINTTKPYLADKRVRQAISYAVDRKGIVDQLLQGIGSVALGPLPESSPWFNEDVPQYDYNIEKAKQLLEEVKWDSGQKIVMAVPKGNIIRERSAPIIQQNLKDIGINVELQYMDFPTLMSQIEEKSYDICLLGTSTGMIDPDANLYCFMHSSQLRPKGWNSANWQDSSIDEILDQAAVETDQIKRKALYDEAQVKILTEAPYIYLYYEENVGATTKRLKNAVPNDLGIEWNIEKWEVEE